MHIRHVVRQFHPAVGGLEDAVGNLAAALARMPGITTSVVTLDRRFRDPAVRLPATDEVGDVPIARIPFRGSTRYPLAPSVLGELDGADIVHVHAIDFFFDFLSLTRVLHRRPLVASTHGGFFHTDFASTLKKVYFNSVTRASAAGYRRIFGSSENDTATFSRIAPRRTVTIENGVNIDKWHDAAAPMLQPAMITIGRFSTNKNIPALIDLVAALRTAGQRWTLILAGQESDLTAADLHAHAGARGVADQIEIATDASDSAIRALIGRASYIASASRYEGFGLSVVEGMSAGLTPILSRIAPFERLVSTTGRGATFDMAASDDVAAALLRFHASQAADQAKARVANMAATARYGWAGVAEQFAAQYRAVLAEPASGA